MEAIKKYMSEYHLKVILKECEERNLSFDEYLVMYLLSKRGNEFWEHVDNLILKHFFGESNEELELDPSLRN